MQVRPCLRPLRAPKQRFALFVVAYAQLCAAGAQHLEDAYCIIASVLVPLKLWLSAP